MSPKRPTRRKKPAASERTVLFTGFPGFIGARLIPRLLELDAGTTFVCLVQEKFVGAAREAVAKMAADHPHTKDRLELVVGDITAPGLGILHSEADALHERLTGCYHLAAVYDLAVKRELAMRVNVDGTRNVLDFLEESPRLERFDYVSTAYVSGTAVGVFRETDLDVGQRFKNAYEETKFLAEVAVKERGLPTATYRPGIVVGDSKTGVTAKFDGPYFSLNAMRHLPSPGVFMKVGSGNATVNLVPVDFVLEAIARLSTWKGSVGKTYNLTDPNPLTAFEIEELFAKALGKSFVYVPVPLPVAKLLFSPPPVEKFFDMPSQTLEYFDHACRYDCTVATADLARFGVTCPPLADYFQRLVRFYLEHVGEISGRAMV
ncbi:SDR family oxidoreductase [Acidobacteria bacterium ACD]|nr:MAG: NAD-dependent epimerase/dehydratase family protein [Acidobacteriota bacterium]MDL1950233.1 SDR family oxidoreductase [Acidobacteria bacterium ACD]